ncbi:MAG: response regulator [Candidatus Moranbacteria bacterium]|jgi:CheY-like chemotaxis protein|nr:response regulator [Candidatus Moranbacteria bacterium]
MADVFGKRVVCIVDDDANIQEIYRVKFESEGFETIAALNGDEGLALIKSQHPDIVLLDLQMPVKDGIEVLESLKRDPELSRIPVVVLSNQDNQESFRRIGELDATRFYLVKSLTTPQKAVDVVREVLH